MKRIVNGIRLLCFIAVLGSCSPDKSFEYKGTVYQDCNSSIPLEGATVSLGTEYKTTTGADGKFVLKGKDPIDIYDGFPDVYIEHLSYYSVISAPGENQYEYNFGRVYTRPVQYVVVHFVGLPDSISINDGDELDLTYKFGTEFGLDYEIDVATLNGNTTEAIPLLLRGVSTAVFEGLKIPSVHFYDSETQLDYYFGSAEVLGTPGSPCSSDTLEFTLQFGQ